MTHGEGGLPPATGGGAGAQNDPEKVRLSEIIAALNSTFGLDLGQNANEALFTKYFDDPAFQSVLVGFMRKEAYRCIRGGEAA